MADIDPAQGTSAIESNDAHGERARSPTPRRRWGRLALMLSVPLVLILIAFGYWLSLQGKVSTDNAYLKQDRISISAEVSGQIIEVNAHEDQRVAKGDLLFKINPEPFRIEAAQADAAIASAQANLVSLANSKDLSGADIAAARENIGFARSTLDRVEALYKRGFSTKADYEAAQHALAEAKAGLEQAHARQREARARLAHGAAVPGENPQIATARSRKAAALYSLSRTEVRAPAAGRIAQADRLQPGQQIVSGLPVLTIVRTDTTYVEANFKETELADMRVGQRAKIAFDAYPGLKLEGHVESIGAGTGSEFSVLPAQNATGNWVKVTQRVPVRIAIDDKSPRQLIAGLSCDVTVYTDEKRN